MPRAAERIAGQLQSIDITTFENDDRDRVKLLAAAQALCYRLETPLEFVQRVSLQEPTFIACLKIADDIKLFEHLSVSPSSVATLAGPTETDPVLLKRVLRQLASRDVVAEVAVPISPSVTSATIAPTPLSESNSCFSFRPRLGSRASSAATSRASSFASIPIEVHYASTRIAQSLTTREASAAIRQTVNTYYPVLLHLPQYLASTGYTNPTDQEDGPFQASPLGSPELAFHKWLQRPSNAAKAEDQIHATKFNTQGLRSWMEIYDPTPLLPTYQTTTSSRRPSTATVNGTGTSSNSPPDDSPTSPDQPPPLLVDLSLTAPTAHLSTSPITTLTFRQHFPATHHPGAVELFTPPHFLDQLSTNPSLATHHITLVGHTPMQPLHPHSAAACFYLLGPDLLSSMHDDNATRLLTNIAAVMARPRSRLLVWDRLVDRVGPHPSVLAGDILRMALHAARDRDEDEWRDLVEGVAGLSLLAVHRDRDRVGGMAVLECVLT